MNKIVTLIGMGLLALGLGACGGATDGPGSASTAVTNDIVVWAWDPNFNIRALEIAADAYASLNPDSATHLIIEESAQDDIVQRLNIMLASGITTDLPNIVLIEDYRAQGFLQAFPGSFYPLEPYFNPADFAPFKNEVTSHNGVQYGIPFDSGVTGIYIRTDILAQAGYTVDDMMYIDWHEFIRIGHAVYEATGTRLMTLDISDLGQVRVMLQSVGSWYTLADGFTPHLADNPYLHMAFELYRELQQSGLTIPITTWGEYVSNVNDGNVWSLMSAVWMTPSVMQAEDQYGLWAVVPTPSMPGVPQAVHASNWGGSSWYVLDIPGREVAAQFLADTFGSNADFYQDILEAAGAMASFLPAQGGRAYQLEVGFFAGQQIFTDFSRWSAQVPQVNFGMHTYAIEDLLSVAMVDFVGGADLQTVLNTAQAQAESQLN